MQSLTQCASALATSQHTLQHRESAIANIYAIHCRRIILGVWYYSCRLRKPVMWQCSVSPSGTFHPLSGWFHSMQRNLSEHPCGRHPSHHLCKPAALYPVSCSESSSRGMSHTGVAPWTLRFLTIESYTCARLYTTSYTKQDFVHRELTHASACYQTTGAFSCRIYLSVYLARIIRSIYLQHSVF